MVPAGNKTKRLSLVNRTTKTIHHHQYQYVVSAHFMLIFHFYTLPLEVIRKFWFSDVIGDIKKATVFW